MRLRLVEPLSPRPPVFELAPVDLRRQPTRPGVTHSTIEFDGRRELALAAARISARAGLPSAVWIGLVIESERALGQLHGDQREAGKLRERLDELARRAEVPVPGAAVRLAAYGRALRSAVPREDRQAALYPAGATVRLTARVPYQAVIAWRRAAIERGQALEVWANERLGSLPRDRSLWEAAAAERGETLAEWVVLHAARR